MKFWIFFLSVIAFNMAKADGSLIPALTAPECIFTVSNNIDKYEQDREWHQGWGGIIYTSKIDNCSAYVRKYKGSENLLPSIKISCGKQQEDRLRIISALDVYPKDRSHSPKDLLYLSYENKETGESIYAGISCKPNPYSDEAVKNTTKN